MKTADVVIVGAGVNGVSTAFHLAKAGVRNVVVVERHHLAAGATGKSGALVRMHYTNEPETRLAADPNATTQSLARAAMDLGVEFLFETEVTGVQTAGDRVTGITTSAGPIQAPVVVIVAVAQGRDDPPRSWQAAEAYSLLGCLAAIQAARSIPMASDQTTAQDPKQQGPTPPFPEQPQDLPGLESEMEPKPDYGEASYRGFGRLAGKAALITGGDSGIGRAVAVAFAREGADVLISYLPEEEPDAQETLRVVREAGQQGVGVPGDIGDEAHCRHLVQQAVEAFGKLDILVNNAAYQMSHESIQELTAAEIERTFRINIFAMFYLSQAALKEMQPGGTIINTASVQAYKPSSNLLAYAATKGAIVTFSKGLSQEALEQGVRVNVVAPGPVWTPLIPASMPPEQASEFGKQSPMQRPAQPAELAPAYVFLASQESSYITGEVIGVTGGTPLG